MSLLPASDITFARQPGDNTGAREQLSARDAADAARVLAGLFGSSEPLETEEACEVVEALARIPGGKFPYRADSEGFRAAWNEKRHLFSGTRIPVRLEESVYKIWTSDKSHPLSGATGLAWGEPAQHMAEVLAGFGMNFDPERISSPDHLSVLLEFLAFLIENGSREDIEAFCADHLNWLSDLLKEARVNDLGRAFVATVETAERLITNITLR